MSTFSRIDTLKKSSFSGLFNLKFRRRICLLQIRTFLSESSLPLPLLLPLKHHVVIARGSWVVKEEGFTIPRCRQYES